MKTILATAIALLVGITLAAPAYAGQSYDPQSNTCFTSGVPVTSSSEEIDLFEYDYQIKERVWVASAMPSEALALATSAKVELAIALSKNLSMLSKGKCVKFFTPFRIN